MPTPREIVRANIEFACDDRIAFNFTGDRRNDFVGGGIKHNITTEQWEDDRFDYYTDIWGNKWFRVKGMSKGGEVYEPVLPDWSELDNLELPELDKPEYFNTAREVIEADTEERFRMGGVPGWPFAVCRYMRKMEVYFTDLILHRRQIDILHDRVTGLLERVIDRYGRIGMDGVFFCEDLGIQDRTLMSPAMWRDIFAPLYERLTAAAHKHGMKVIQHSCGYNWALVDDLCAAGIDCLQFDQPALYDMPALAEKLKGHGVGLFCPCDIQKVLPTGDRALIESQTRRQVELFRGGLIAKDYPDLHGIGVKPEWDMWAYETFVEEGMPGQEA